MGDKIYTILESKELENSTVMMTGRVEWADLHPYYTRRLDKLGETTEVAGFRKGKAPQASVEQEVGQMNILQQASQDVLGDVYPAMVMEQKLSIIGYPQVAITKMAYGSPLEFSVTTAVRPEITLPDYRAIAQKMSKEEIVVEVTEEEFNEAVERVRKMHAHTVKEEGSSPESGSEPAELTDALVAQWGEYQDVEDFQRKFREEMREGKHSQARAERREKIVKAIVEKTELDLPEVLVEAEQDKMLAAVKDDVTRMGLEYEAWLKHSGKTEEEIREEMQEDARARAQADLVLQTIARAEKITPDEEKIDQQREVIQKAHQDVPEEHIRAYLEHVYLNEAVLQFLEGENG